MSRSFCNLQFKMAFVIESELLIPEVEKYPCLYNVYCEDYPDRNAKTRAWRKIAAVLNPELRDSEKTAFVREIQRRWKCIRDAYLKSLKRKEHIVGGKKPRKMKHYVYMKMLDFILPFLEIPHQKNQVGYLKDACTPTESNEYSALDDEEVKYSSILANQQKESQDSSSDSSFHRTPARPSTSTNDSQFSSAQNTHNTRSSRRRRSIVSDEVHSDPSQPFILNLRSNGYTNQDPSLLELSPSSSSTSHRFDLLFTNWCEKMKTLPNDQRIFAEKLINDVFFEAELNRLGNGCRIVVSS